MDILAQTEHARLYWYDNSEENILIMDIDWGWTWAEAHEAIKMNNEILAQQAQKHPVYCIFNFTSMSLLPKGGGAIANIRKLLETDPSVEQLQIFVIRFNLLRILINSAMVAYNLARIEHKYHYVTSLDEALRIIEKHRTLPQENLVS